MRMYSRDQVTRDATPAPVIRERPASMRDAAHVSREAETTRLDDVHLEFDANHAFNPTSLKAPPPRSGFKQRWVADGTNPLSDKSEQRNWFSKHRMGWRPRDPETVPAQLRQLYPSIKLHDGSLAIRVAGSVLCEMPQQVAAQYSEAVRDRIGNQSKAVPESLEQLRQRERVGVGALEIVDRKNSYRGRKAANFVD